MIFSRVVENMVGRVEGDEEILGQDAAIQLLIYCQKTKTSRKGACLSIFLLCLSLLATEPIPQW